MPLKPENIILEEKIIAGIKKAQRRLLEERAKAGGTVIVSKNGVPVKISATEVLKILSR